MTPRYCFVVKGRPSMPARWRRSSPDPDGPEQCIRAKELSSVAAPARLVGTARLHPLGDPQAARAGAIVGRGVRERTPASRGGASGPAPAPLGGRSKQSSRRRTRRRAAAPAHNQACAVWTRHDCFGSRGCSGLAMPLPRERKPERVGSDDRICGNAITPTLVSDVIAFDRDRSRRAKHRGDRFPPRDGTDRAIAMATRRNL